MRREKKRITRRDFMTGAAGLSFALMEPGLVKAAKANSKINAALIGCGRRGTWIAELFRKHGGYNFVAAADYFQDRVDVFGTKFNIPAKSRHTTLSGHLRMLEKEKSLDAIVVESPGYFHPEQVAAGIEAGKHVYVAKPIAIDVPGCQSLGESGKKATAKKLVLLVDFQTRANEFYQEAVKRVLYGDIGRVVCGEAVYQCGPAYTRMFDMLAKNPNDPETRIRAWGLNKVLSGDTILDQGVHVLDVATWIIDKHPVSAYGTGGRKARTDAGDCWDHFAAVYKFPNVVLNYCNRQFGTGYDDLLCRMYGKLGTIETHYGGEVIIRGSAPYKGGKTSGIYAGGAVNNIATFYEDITKGRYANVTVEPSVRSTMTVFLGRTAAYKHTEVTWDDMMRANEKLEYDLKGLKS